MKKYNFWSLLLFIPFGLGLYVALTECISGFERGVFDLLRNLAPAMDIPFRGITELGSAVGVIIITVLIFVITAITRKYFFTVGLPVAITVIISRIVNITLKNVLDRPRPEFKVIFADESSFPSGHSQNNMALYICLLLCLLLVVTAPKWRLILKVALIALPLLIGITRIYFGVHYISDVIAGWSMGAFIAILINYLYLRIYNNIKDKRNAKA
ncbi:MAG: phosphatase PAP2 family protein [Clostridia bacterium]|nr:phosphatase PAP2 family protein [Clostridia bacterium]